MTACLGQAGTAALREWEVREGFHEEAAAEPMCEGGAVRAPGKHEVPEPAGAWHVSAAEGQQASLLKVEILLYEERGWMATHAGYWSHVSPHGRF